MESNLSSFKINRSEIFCIIALIIVVSCTIIVSGHYRAEQQEVQPVLKVEKEQ